MISEYLSNAILNAVLDGSAYSSPTNLYLGLCKSAPIFQTDTVADEVATGGGTLYERKVITFDTTDHGITYSTAKVTFPNAGADWSTELLPITHWFISDTDVEGAGRWLFAGKLECPLIVLNGDPGPVVYPKAIMISLRGQLDS